MATYVVVLVTVSRRITEKEKNYHNILTFRQNPNVFVAKAC